jgi:hypothetical protein
MNNMCPTCGAIYNVAGKDIGRRIKCKKCGTGLIVNESGLEIDDPNAPVATPKAAVEPEDDFEDVEAPRRQRDRRPAGPAFNPKEALAKLGGIPTILFGFGVFIVLFVGFQEAVGKAKIERRQAAIDEGLAEVNDAQRRYDEKKEKKPEDEKALTQTKENWEKKKKDLEADRLSAELANKRGNYWDKYFLMLGFMFIAFGCLGYLLADYGLVLRIVAAVIMLFMIMALFKAAVGASAGVGASVGLG